MKGGVTKKLEDTVVALEKGQLKKALYLTDREEMAREHEVVKDVARTCLANKNKCPEAMKAASEKIKIAITPPLEGTELEGVEEFLEPGEQPKAEAKAEVSDEELYKECEECHVATAITAFHAINTQHPSEIANELIEENIGKNIEPVGWIKNMVQVTEASEGEAKEKYSTSLGELTTYLEGRDSPFLKELDEEAAKEAETET